MQNFYLQAAIPALILALKIKHITSHSDVNTLREQFIHEINLFEHILIQKKINEGHILAARYCLCTSIDESILSTHWGTQSPWAQQTLLSYFQQDTWGGERFYLILEHLIQDPVTNIQLLEFLYLLLSLGFEGQFFDKGNLIREEIRNKIFNCIKHCRGKMTRTLSTHWKDEIALQSNKSQRKSIKLIIVFCGLFIMGMSCFLNIKSYLLSLPLINSLQKLATLSPITAYSQLIERN